MGVGLAVPVGGSGVDGEVGAVAELHVGEEASFDRRGLLIF